jgi:catalase
VEWDLKIQVIPERDGYSYKWNIFDVTKVIPHGDYPLIPVGKLVLNRSVDNYFAETEQAAFSPGHLVPGIEPSVDKMLQGRLFSYPDTHRHRLGANYEQIPINCPYRAKVNNGQRDGPMRVDRNGGMRNIILGSGPNYEPNSFNKGTNSFTFNSEARYEPYKVTGLVARHKPNHPNCDFSQPGTLFRKVMDSTMKTHTIQNTAGSMNGVARDILERAVKNFYKADSEFGEGIAKILGFPAVKSRL